MAVSRGPNAGTRTMYCEFFGFRESPFTITPNSRFIYFSKNHREAFAHLFYGVTNRAGFIELTGEVGAGKTTVIRTLLNRLDEERYRTALILNPCLSGVELMRNINREFGLQSEELGSSELLHELNRFLLVENAAGRIVVLVIDEAQNLTPQVLEQIRLISNLETETSKLIQIVLAGQPELGALLERADLRQLSQRIAVRYHLKPMDFTDTRAYIEHRLEIAGSRFAARFTRPALGKIYRFSAGLPRPVNMVCDRSLLVAFGDGRRRISSATVSTAIREIRRERTGARPLRRLGPVLAVIAFLCLAGGFYLYQRDRTVDADTSPRARKTVPATVSADSVTPDPTRTSEAENGRQALTVLARLWGAAGPLPPPGEGGLEGLRTLAQGADLRVDSVRTNLDLLRYLGVPVMLEVKLPGVQGDRYLALIGIDNEVVRVSPPLGGDETLTRKRLGSIWNGRCYLVWRNYLDIPFILSRRADERDMREVRRLLKQNGFPSSGKNSGSYSSLEASLKSFQKSRGIPSDGRLGALTLLLLYRDAGDFAVPRLEKGRKGRSR